MDVIYLLNEEIVYVQHIFGQFLTPFLMRKDCSILIIGFKLVGA